MNFLKTITLLAFLLSTQLGISQNAFKVGPSALVNVGFFNEDVTLPLGVEVGYEYGIGKQLSLNVAGMFYYSEHESWVEENRINDIKQEDTYLGAQVDIRYHFVERFKGAYIGLGTDVKHLNAKNYFAPTTEDPTPTLVNTEFNVGISYGGYIKLGNSYLNPNIYIGGNPSDQNEYELHAKLGLNYVF